jgi:hypothetical protein
LPTDRAEGMAALASFLLLASLPARATSSAAAPWAVVRIEGEDDKSCVAARIWNKATGRGAPETFVSGVCHAAEDSVFSEISTCSDDGKTLEQQFFMNPNCEGQPQSDTVLQQNHCSEAANGMHYSYACRPAAAQDDTIGEAKGDAMMKSPSGPVPEAVLEPPTPTPSGPVPAPVPEPESGPVLTETAALWAVVRIEGEDDKRCVASRIWYKATGKGALEAFVSGVCHAAEDSVFSEISTCSDDGKTLEQQFFMNPNCEGQPQSDTVLQQNHCSEAANGMHYAYFCRPAPAPA